MSCVMGQQLWYKEMSITLQVRKPRFEFYAFYLQHDQEERSGPLLSATESDANKLYFRGLLKNSVKLQMDGSVL